MNFKYILVTSIVHCVYAKLPTMCDLSEKTLHPSTTPSTVAVENHGTTAPTLTPLYIPTTAPTGPPTLEPTVRSVSPTTVTECPCWDENYWSNLTYEECVKDLQIMYEIIYN